MQCGRNAANDSHGVGSCFVILLQCRARSEENRSPSNRSRSSPAIWRWDQTRENGGTRMIYSGQTGNHVLIPLMVSHTPESCLRFHRDTEALDVQTRGAHERFGPCLNSLQILHASPSAHSIGCIKMKGAPGWNPHPDSRSSILV